MYLLYAEDRQSLEAKTKLFEEYFCISVLEHIPAPHDQTALREMLRILKPGGVLVVTVDYTPPLRSNRESRLGHYMQRVAALVERGDLAEIGRGVWRKVKAQQAVYAGAARLARSANQCFEIEHLELDILPIVQKYERVASRLPFSTDLRSLTPDDARRFWTIDGLYSSQDFRAVLPAALIVRKPVVDG